MSRRGKTFVHVIPIDTLQWVDPHQTYNIHSDEYREETGSDTPVAQKRDCPELPSDAVIKTLAKASLGRKRLTWLIGH